MSSDQRGCAGVRGAPEQEVQDSEPKPSDVRVVPGALCWRRPWPGRHLLLPDAGTQGH